ncbi:odorant receptor 45a-like [Cochliomyia hominivorax]
MFQKSKINREQYFNVPPRTFKFIGLDPLAKNPRDIVKYPIICYSHYLLSFLFGLAIMDFGLKNYHDFEEFILVISVLNQLILSLWKVGIFLKKRQRIHELIQDILQWNEKVSQKSEIEIMNRIGGHNNFISKLFYWAVGISSVNGLLRPLIKFMIKKLYKLEAELEIPHKASFFWDTTTPMGYTVALMWNIIVVNFICNASVAIDTLFLWLVSNIRIRFALLEKRFQVTSETHNSFTHHSSLVENIKFHCDILKMSQELTGIYGEIIFLKSLISCTQICFLAVCLTREASSVISRCYPFAFLVAVAIQLFLYCYSGELIKEESLKISSHIYEVFDLSVLTVAQRKTLQIIMLRCQKSSQITGIFFNLDLRLYLWFFKTAGSLIAVLKTLDDEV